MRTVSIPPFIWRTTTIFAVVEVDGWISQQATASIHRERQTATKTERRNRRTTLDSGIHHYRDDSIFFLIYSLVNILLSLVNAFA